MSAVERRMVTRRVRSAGARRQPRRAHAQGSSGAWLALVGFLLCLAALGLALTGAFRVRTVHVVGAHLPAGTIARVAAVSGRNIFRLRTDQVIDRLATLRAVRVLKVDASFPSTVTIYARIDRPVLAWRQGRGLVLLDASGVQIGRVSTTALPVVTGFRAPSATQVQAIRYAVRVLPASVDGAVAGFTVAPRVGLQVAGKTGWRATLGDGSSRTMVVRVGALAAILNSMPARDRRLLTADLRFDQPVVRLGMP